MINKSKTSVAFFNPLSQIGGAEVSLIELIKATKDTFDYLVILPAQGELKEEFDKLGVDTEILEWHKHLRNLGERGKQNKFIFLMLGLLKAKIFAVKLDNFRCF